MPRPGGFLKSDDAAEAGRRGFDNWISDQLRKEQAFQALSQVAAGQGPIRSPATIKQKPPTVTPG